MPTLRVRQQYWFARWLTSRKGFWIWTVVPVLFFFKQDIREYAIYGNMRQPRGARDLWSIVASFVKQLIVSWRQRRVRERLAYLRYTKLISVRLCDFSICNMITIVYKINKCVIIVASARIVKQMLVSRRLLVRVSRFINYLHTYYDKPIRGDGSLRSPGLQNDSNGVENR